MFKIFSPYSFDTDFDPVQVVRLHSRGVDREWMKAASAECFIREFEEYDLKPGHTLVQIAPVAESERFSCNVNGDGFNKDACRQFHPTFLSGHAFEEHDNKSPEKSYGKPVATAYNEKMGRIELLVDIDDAKNPTVKEALEAGTDVDWSMACRIDFDVCNVCGNKATTPRGPCDQPVDVPSPGYCKHARTQLGVILEDGHRVFVDNPHPNFFDISKVATPAEVIARTTRFRKAASGSELLVPFEQTGVGMAEAAGLEAPLYVRVSLPAERRSKLALARKLAEMEKDLPAAIRKYRSVACGAPKNTDEAEEIINGILSDVEKKTASADNVLAQLREEGIVLGLKDFNRLTKLASGPVVDEALGLQGRMFHRLSNRNLLADVASDGTYDRPQAKKIAHGLRDKAKQLAPYMSLDPEHVRRRLIETEGVKIGSSATADADPSAPADRLLCKYAAYLLSEIARDGEGTRVALTVLHRSVK